MTYIDPATQEAVDGARTASEVAFLRAENRQLRLHAKALAARLAEVTAANHARDWNGQPTPVTPHDHAKPADPFARWAACRARRDHGQERGAVA